MSNLINAKCRVIIRYPWYGVFISRFKWVKLQSIETIGVRFTSNADVECVYNPEFIDSLTLEQSIAVLRHEVEHIVRLHPSRSRYYKGDDYNHKLWNMAIDWVVNGTKNNPRIENLPEMGCFIPDRNNNDDIKFWKGCDLKTVNNSMTAEEYYNWLKKNTKKKKIKIKINVRNGKSGIESEATAVQTLGGRQIDIETIDNHEQWGDSGISPEEMRRVAKDLADCATKQSGSAPGHLTDAISSLEKPQHNWVYKFRNMIGRYVGGKRRTFARRNRKHDKFGIKGISSHANIKLVVMVDTSGSMSKEILRKVFTEIEAMSQYFKILLVQFDVGVNDVTEYHRGDWNKIEIKGRGGTSFKSAFDYLEKNKLVGQMNVMLTDGYDALPTEREYPVTWVIVGQEGIDYLGGRNNIWGDVVLIKDDYHENGH